MLALWPHKSSEGRAVLLWCLGAQLGPVAGFALGRRSDPQADEAVLVPFGCVNLGCRPGSSPRSCSAEPGVSRSRRRRRSRCLRHAERRSRPAER